MGVHYAEIKYEQRNRRTIEDYVIVQENDQQMTKTLEDFQEYLDSQNNTILEEIHSNKKDPGQLRVVIDDWLTEQSELAIKYEKDQIIDEMMKYLVGWGMLQDLIEDKMVTNIFTNEKLEVIKRVRGKDVKTNLKFESVEQLELYIKALCMRLKVKISRNLCIQDAMDDVYRVRINCAISGSILKQDVVKVPYLTLRTYSVDNYEKDFFIKNGTMNEDIAEFTKDELIFSNVIVAGEPDAGKTTFLDFMASIKNEIDPMWRSITIEEDPELSTPKENSISFIARKITNPEEDKRKPYDMSEFAKQATRSAGREFVIGELRGPEAWWGYRLLSIGLKGQLTTHGSDVVTALEQMAFLMSLEASNVEMSILIQKVCQMMDFVVYISHRKVVEIAEVIGYDYEKNAPITNPIFKLKIDGNGEAYWEKGQLSEAYMEQKRIDQYLKERSV